MIEMVKVEAIEEIAPEFVARAHAVVWCNVATADAEGRLRSRIMHPVWEGHTGWLTTRSRSPKMREIAANPYISLCYAGKIADAAYADCRVEIIDAPAERRRAWDFIAALPAPAGFDPAPLYISPDDPGFGLLRLTPWRIELSDLPARRRVWQAR